MGRVRLETLPKATLIKLIQMYSRNWNTVDGLWFRAVEEEYGLEVATRLDMKMWEKQIQIEARRIKEVLHIGGEGPEVLLKIMGFTTSLVGGDLEYECEEVTPTAVVFYYTRCHPQEMRARQGLKEFPCKEVGLAIHTKLAEAVDPRVKAECLVCPPDPHPEEFWCKWAFRLSSDR